MHIVLFDIDGTLISSGGAGKLALERALESEFGIGGVIEQLDFRGRTDRSIIQDLFRLHVIDDTPENWDRIVTGYLRHLPDALQDSPGRVLPGVQTLLDELYPGDEVRVGLLTGNLREGARLKLGHFGLFHYFAFGGFGDLHLDRDEVAREALAEIHRLHGVVEPGRVWVVGDTPLDVRCARAIGARAVAVCTGWHDPSELAACGPDLLLTDLSDPGPLLARWL